MRARGCRACQRPPSISAESYIAKPARCALCTRRSDGIARVLAGAPRHNLYEFAHTHTHTSRMVKSTRKKDSRYLHTVTHTHVGAFGPCRETRPHRPTGRPGRRDASPVSRLLSRSRPSALAQIAHSSDFACVGAATPHILYPTSSRSVPSISQTIFESTSTLALCRHSSPAASRQLHVVGSSSAAHMRHTHIGLST